MYPVCNSWEVFKSSCVCVWCIYVIKLQCFVSTSCSLIGPLVVIGYIEKGWVSDCVVSIGQLLLCCHGNRSLKPYQPNSQCSH